MSELRGLLLAELVPLAYLSLVIIGKLLTFWAKTS